MPVPINRTDWRLDRLIGFGRRDSVLDPLWSPLSLISYASSNRIVSPNKLTGPFIFQPHAQGHVLIADAPQVGTQAVRQAGIAGTLRLGVQMVVDGRLVEISGFFDPGEFPVYRDYRRQVATVAEDGQSATFFFVPQEDAGFPYWCGVGVTLSPALSSASAGLLLVNNDGYQSVVYRQQGKMWAQVQEAISTVESESGAVFAVASVVEDDLTIITRRPVRRADSFLLVDGFLCDVVSVEQLVRGRYWQVLARTRSVRITS